MTAAGGFQSDPFVGSAAYQARRPFLDATEEQMTRAFDANVWALVRPLRAIIPAMMARRYGRIVTVGGLAFEAGSPWHAFLAGVGKGSVVGLTSTLAGEFGGFGITVNCVSPGGMETRNDGTPDSTAGGLSPELNPSAEEIERYQPPQAGAGRSVLRRGRAHPSEVAAAIAFFGSPEASFVTGQLLKVSAGVSGRPGVCAAQIVGALNLAAGLRDAWLAHSPVIALTGGRDPKTKFRQVYQEVDDVPAFEPVTKFNATIDDVARFPDMVRQAFRVATSGTPGPVHLQFRGNEGQVDVEEAEMEPLVEPLFARVPAFRPQPDEAVLVQAIELLRRAQRPVLVAGGGVRASGAAASLRLVAEALDVPVATSLNGKDAIDARHRLSVGVVARVVLDRMRELIGADTATHDGWLREVESIRAAWRAKYASVLTSDDVPTRPERICSELTRLAPDDAIIVVDTGHAGMWMGGFFDVRDDQSYLRSCGHLGWAFPAAMGAKCAAPDRPTIVFTGDAGLWYHVAELETAVRWKINTVTVVNLHRRRLRAPGRGRRRARHPR